MASRTEFSVKKNSNFYLNDSDRSVLLFLYKPIIGPQAYNLYEILYELCKSGEEFKSDPILLIDL